MLKVLKFGGSSMADAAQFAKVRDIIRYDDTPRVIVVSAPGKRFKEDHKVTDLLYLCHAHLKYGVSFDSVFDMIETRFLDIKRDLQLDTPIESELEMLREKMRRGISEDELVSRGEYFCARLMADYLGYRFIDAASWLRFNFDASVNYEESYRALSILAEGGSAVIPGFYGAMPDGSIKTFSRGGSDISGALVAAALNADVYENWTDVSGVLMADPRIVENPEPIRRITYSELRELSYLGAQVLHEETVFPVLEKNIPLNIRNTNDPSNPGTIIMESFPADQTDSDNRFITGIAGRKDYSIITIAKRGFSSAFGIQRKVLEILEHHSVSVEYMPNGIDSISLVIPAKFKGEPIYAVLRELQSTFDPDKLEVVENIAIVAAIGRKMAFRPGISGKIFATLGENGINIRMISQGPQEVNIVVGVDNNDYAAAIRVLYNSFVK